MSNSTDLPSGNDKHVSMAAYWHTLAESGEMTNAERRKFHTWFIEDPRNADAFTDMFILDELTRETMKKNPDVFRDLNAEGLKREQPAPKRALQSKGLGLRIAAAIGCLALTGAVYLGIRSYFEGSNTTPIPQLYETATGEMRWIGLEDGSKISINTRTRVRINNPRHVELLEGEAMFDVAPDKSKPFRVNAGSSTIEVLGTRFNVYRTPEGTMSITVAEGTIKVSQFEPAWSARVGANQTLEYSIGSNAPRLRPNTPADDILWPSHQIRTTDETLAEFVDKLKRYTNATFIFANPAIRDERLGPAVFTTLEVPSILSSLESQGQLKVIPGDNRYVLDYQKSDFVPRQIQK